MTVRSLFVSRRKLPLTPNLSREETGVGGAVGGNDGAIVGDGVGISVGV